MPRFRPLRRLRALFTTTHPGPRARLRGRGGGGVDGVRQDLRYAVRSLRAAPAFTAVAVTTLALGIGATTGVFGVVDALLVRPLDLREGERVVRVFEDRVGAEQRWGTISAPNFRDWMAQSSVFQAGALFDEYDPVLRRGGETVKLPGASVGAAYFDVLGLRPAVGRFFLPEEEAVDSRRVVLSHALWRDRFGSDPGVVGEVIDLNATPYTVVGVAPPFEDPGLTGASFDRPLLWRSPPGYFETNGRGSRSFTAVFRLRPGVTLDAARSELRRIHAALAAEYPDQNRDREVRLEPLKETLVGDVRPVLRVLMASVALVLLIACANVANLLLFRAAGRGREMSLRTALGASRRRIVRQLMVESALLALLGAGLGIGLAYLSTEGVVRLAAGQLPRLESVEVSLRMLAFAVAAAAGAALLFGLLPALQATDVDAGAALRDGGRGATGSRRQSRLRSAVVAAEVALAVVVLLGAGLLARSLLRLGAVDPGVVAERALTVRIDPPFDPYGPSEADDGAAFTALMDRVTGAVRTLPGVDAVGSIDLLPMSGSFNGNSVWVAGRPRPAPGDYPSAETRAVGAGYFEAMGIRSITGRTIEGSDRGDAERVVVVSEAFVREHWPEGADPVGEGVHLFDVEEPAARVIGVVADVSQFTLDRPPTPTVYLPRDQAPLWMRGEPHLVIRSAGDPAALAGAVTAAIHRVDAAIPVYAVRPMEAVVDATLVRHRFRTLLLLAFAALAFALSAIGVYGMVAYTVARRRPEIGVRLALGADAARIRALFLRQGLRPVLTGAALGLVGGLLAVRLLADLLYEVPATDPLTFIAAPVAMTLSALAASWIPARRAARTSPGEVLRGE